MSSEVEMLGFLLVVVAMLLLLGFRLEMVSRLQGGVQRAGGDRAALQLALLHDDVTRSS